MRYKIARDDLKAASTIRIIGGQWRGRMIPVPVSPTLRPSPDRVRETLFNWLQPIIAGAGCLDLFAGSGALGIEAVSRGAAHAMLVERDRRTVQYARAFLHGLDSEAITVVEADAFEWLEAQMRIFDIVFLDPPFGRGLLERSVTQLRRLGMIARHSMIYIENDRRWQPPTDDLKVIKQACAGQVHYALLKYLK